METILGCFPTLKKLNLRNLPELIGKPLWKDEYEHHKKQRVGSAPIKIDWLSNLNNLRLEKCDKIESVFSAPVARGLVQLQKIFICRCQLIEAVVIPSEGGDICKAEKATIDEDEEEEIMFPELQKLVLESLPYFSSFCKVNAAIKMPKLNILKLINLPKITSLCLPPTTTNSDHGPIIKSCFNKVYAS